jgi:hypothetical protein
MPSSDPAVVWAQRMERRRPQVAVAFCAVLTVATFGVAWALYREEPSGGWHLVVAFACVLALITLYGYLYHLHRNHDPRSITTGEFKGVAATFIRQRAALLPLLATIMVCAAALVMVPGVRSAWSGEKGWPGVLLFWSAVAAIFAAPAVTIATGRLHRGYLALTPGGVFHRGWAFESSLPWEDIYDARAVQTDHRTVVLLARPDARWLRRYTTRRWRQDRLPPVPAVSPDCRKFAVHDDVLFRYLRAYTINPGLRGELGTPASLRRAEALAAHR